MLWDVDRLFVFLLEMFDDVFERLVLADELERSFGADALDGVEVVAAEQDAQIDELRHRHAEPLECLGEVDLVHGQLLLLGRRKMLQQDRRTKRKRVHVLGARGVHFAGARQLSTLRLGLGRRNDTRNAHELQQVAHLLVVLPRRAHLSPCELVHLFDVGNVLLLLLLLPCFFAAAKAFLEQLLLEVGRGAVKDVHGLNTVVDHAEGSVEEAEQMRGSLAGLGHELLSIVLADGDEKLVERHGSIDGDLATKVGLDLHLLDSAGRLVGYEGCEAFDTHFVCGKVDRVGGLW